jgi:hypothetical protein
MSQTSSTPSPPRKKQKTLKGMVDDIEQQFPKGDKSDDEYIAFEECE